MRQRWEDYDRSAEYGPLAIVLRAGAGIIIGCIVIGSVLWVVSWFTETAQVVKEQLGPRELLRKYEWFKDTAAGLDRLRANGALMQSRLKSHDEGFVGVAMKDWPRDAREQRAVWQSEVAGVKAAYNQLAAEYNSAMAKANWQFTNVGDLPAGANQPLPREFKPYIED